MTAHARQALDALRHLGDRWAVRTFGPLREPTADVAALAAKWRGRADGLKALYNGLGGTPPAPLPAHGVVSRLEERT